jgi:hypothetical protein
VKHFAKKVDSNQSEIVADLRTLGIQTHIIGEPCDLLTVYKYQTVLIEVKTLNTAIKYSQLEFFGMYKGHCGFACSTGEAELIAKAPRQHGLSENDKRKLLAICHRMEVEGQKTIKIRELRKRLK